MTDAKSGYHHIPMHRDTRAYLAMKSDGKPCAYSRDTLRSHMPFGLATACRTYTTVMFEVHRPFRLNSQNMKSFVDDTLSKHSVMSTCLRKLCSHRVNPGVRPDWQGIKDVTIVEWSCLGKNGNGIPPHAHIRN